MRRAFFICALAATAGAAALHGTDGTDDTAAAATVDFSLTDGRRLSRRLGSWENVFADYHEHFDGRRPSSITASPSWQLVSIGRPAAEYPETRLQPPKQDVKVPTTRHYMEDEDLARRRPSAVTTSPTWRRIYNESLAAEDLETRLRPSEYDVRVSTARQNIDDKYLVEERPSDVTVSSAWQRVSNRKPLAAVDSETRLRSPKYDVKISTPKQYIENEYFTEERPSDVTTFPSWRYVSNGILAAEGLETRLRSPKQDVRVSTPRQYMEDEPLVEKRPSVINMSSSWRPVSNGRSSAAEDSETRLRPSEYDIRISTPRENMEDKNRTGNGLAEDGRWIWADSNETEQVTIANRVALTGDDCPKGYVRITNSLCAHPQ